MQTKLLSLSVAGLVLLGGFGASENFNESSQENLKKKSIEHKVKSASIDNVSFSTEDAEDFVQQLLNIKENAHLRVEYDHTNEHDYVIHVYELVKEENHSHTATTNWYLIDKETGEVSTMMERF
ncbi:hypothetical protein [Pontibacillus marinus]|uniref:Uncharacterized protein n=1 Tax=Pontibacillus marinus BH030004 = DSM 16465 TaxID=1385511 RepID=A0A0A5GC50_9BACI|nr:hypothetical protein [Pontibacillus marinus]KGX89579.1 hypothetical protein N783_05360 [Pontibacillus marinus BH030004 = DSM 16465]